MQLVHRKTFAQCVKCQKYENARLEQLVSHHDLSIYMEDHHSSTVLPQGAESRNIFRRPAAQRRTASVDNLKPLMNGTTQWAAHVDDSDAKHVRMEWAVHVLASAAHRALCKHQSLRTRHQRPERAETIQTGTGIQL
jgi:hypothetical protein